MSISDKIAKFVIDNLKKGVPQDIIFRELNKRLESTSLSNNIPKIKQKVITELKKINNFENAVLETPYEISEDTKNLILKNLDLEGKNVSLKINESLLAGFKLTVSGKVFEANAKKEYINILKKYT